MGDFFFSSNGPRGNDGAHGRNGNNGNHSGDHGARGNDAQLSTPGIPAGSSYVTLESHAGGGSIAEKKIYVTGTAFDIRGAQMCVRDTIIDANNLGVVVATSVGGDGGNGGNGGRGGNGARGRDGHDATQSSSGTNGSPGGNGGDGGRGTSGSDGGQGGLVQINVFAGDEYLLMAVNGIDEPIPSGIVHGGKGGAAGRHGQAGSGGRGGSGGSSYSWTETHHSTSTENGETVHHTTTTSHHNSGGFPGSSGNDGKAPNDPLYPGRNASYGRVELVVNANRINGATVTYPRRYDLDMSNFYLAEEAGSNVDGVFEFGEFCHAAGLTLRNFGHMPSPRQRVLLNLQRGQWVQPLGDELFTEANRPIAIDESRSVEGRLRFRINMPQTKFPEDFGPLMSQELVRPVAIQLGEEYPDLAPRDTPFQRRYKQVMLTRQLTAKFPVGNSRGVLGLHSLASGESSFLYFDVFNCSNLPLGLKSGRRNVCLSLSVKSDNLAGDIPPDPITLAGPDGNWVTLSKDSGDDYRMTTDGYHYQDMSPRFHISKRTATCTSHANFPCLH